ncbi:MAG: metallophosphoesterase family protein [Bacteroidaceae bacterium]|nr:metallophosphoesterase family protein [Bacteroidaceae bacterium]
MKRIGILSDTHGVWDARYAEHFAGCDEIWHAGDIGSMEVAERLSALVPVFRAVHGNIDGGDVRRMYPELLRFRCEEADVLLKHIGGYPGHYDRSVAQRLRERPPHLFVSGHSHILKVMYDRTLSLLHINPGAAGTIGWHRQRTLVRLVVDGHDFRDCQVIELA